jgi:uncharacterized FlgJ-related protein
MGYNLPNLKKVAAALINAGARGKEFIFLLSQAAHETGDFDSRIFNTHNNASGITWANKPYQLNATKGSPLPEDKRYFYAKFKSLDDWAKDYIRILGTSAKSSATLSEFAQKLKTRKYYTDTVANYAKALKYHYNELIKIDLPKPSGAPNLILLFAGIGLFLYLSR